VARIAIVEDDAETNDLFAGWIRAGRPEDQVDQYLDLYAAGDGFKAKRYDLICLDIELNRDKKAGLRLTAPYFRTQDCPVLVISGAPAQADMEDTARAVLAWDYIQKPITEPEVLLSYITRAMHHRRMYAGVSTALVSGGAPASLPVAPPTVAPPTETAIAPVVTFGLRRAHWGKLVIDLTITHQEILKVLIAPENIGRPVKDDVLCKVLISGQNFANLRQHIREIVVRFKLADEHFKQIRRVPSTGYLWIKD
jgi:DNA-binding response OmpR family regulator